MRRDYRVDVRPKNDRGKYVVDVRWIDLQTLMPSRRRPSYATKEEATKQANLIRSRLAQGEEPFLAERDDRAPRPTVREVLDVGKATDRGAQHIAAIEASALGSMPAEDFDLADLEGFKAEREKGGAGPKTSGKDLAFLKRKCRHAKALGLIDSHFFERLDGDKDTRRRLMPTYNPLKDSAGREIPAGAFERIFSCLHPDARRAVLWAWTTGSRLGEVAALDWREHWSPEGFRPIVQKKCRPRVVAYDPAVLGQRRPGGLVFAEMGASAKEIYGHLQAKWRYAVKAADVGHFRFHDLRHTYGTILRRKGTTFSDIAAIMGITEPMAHVYAHEDTERIQIEAQRIVAHPWHKPASEASA